MSGGFTKEHCLTLEQIEAIDRIGRFRSWTYCLPTQLLSIFLAVRSVLEIELNMPSKAKDSFTCITDSAVADKARLWFVFMMKMNVFIGLFRTGNGQSVAEASQSVSHCGYR